MPGQGLYDRRQAELVAAGCDGFVEGRSMVVLRGTTGGRPSLPSGRWLRMLLDCYCEDMGSERGVEWSCANSQSLTEPLHRGDRDAVPDHSR